MQNFQKIQKLLQGNDFIYVADSKLATMKNLSGIQTFDGRLISIMPSTWAEDNELRDKMKTEKQGWKM